MAGTAGSLPRVRACALALAAISPGLVRGSHGPPPGTAKPRTSQGCAASGAPASQSRAASRAPPGGASASTRPAARGGVSVEALAAKQHRQGFAGVGHADEALRAAAAGRQAERDFGKAETRARVVRGEAPMTGQRDLERAAEGASLHRRGDGLAAGLHAPGERVETHGGGEHGGGVFEVGQRRAARVGVRRDDDEHAARRVVADRGFDRFGEGCDGRGVEQARGPRAQAQCDGGDAVGVDVEAGHGTRAVRRVRGSSPCPCRRRRTG